MTRHVRQVFSRRGLAGVIAVVVAGWPAFAQAQPGAAHRPELSDTELGDIRGGFMVEGITFGFGAQVRTYVDGTLAMQTELTWTDKGAATRQTNGGAGVPIGDGKDIAGMNLAGLKGADGLVLEGQGGATVIAQRITAGQIDNLVVNTASNRTIRQDIQLNLVLPDLAKMQSGFALQQSTLRMDNALSDSAMNALRR